MVANVPTVKKTLIEKAFSPLFSREKIPEIIFNPANATLRDDRITEFVGNLPDEELKRFVLDGFKNMTESSIYEKIMLFFGLFVEKRGIDLEEFEANKVRIFGDEIKRVSLEEEYFKGFFKERTKKEG